VTAGGAKRFTKCMTTLLTPPHLQFPVQVSW